MSLPTHRPTLRELCAPAFCVLCVRFFLGLLFSSFPKTVCKTATANSVLFNGALSLFRTLFHSCRNKSRTCHIYEKDQGCPLPSPQNVHYGHIARFSLCALPARAMSG